MTPELSPKQQKFLQSYGLTEDQPVEWFTRQPALLLAYMLLSLGAYGLYWFYRNWDAVRAASGKKMLPFLRAFFAVFYAWPLFKIMILQARARGFSANYSGGALAVGYVAPSFAVAFTPYARTYNDTFLKVEIAIAVISLAVFLLAQRAIMFDDARKHVDAYNPTSQSEVFFIALVCIFPGALNLLGR